PLSSRYAVLWRKVFPMMGPVQVEQRAERNDPGRIDLVVSYVVMTFDVVQIHGVGNARLLIEIAQIAIEVRVIDNPPEIAFEVAKIDGVKTNQRAKETPIGFDDSIPKQVTTGGQSLFKLVQRAKDRTSGFLISALACGKPGSIHAVVYVLVDESAELVLLCGDIGRKEIHRAVAWPAEHTVEHSADVVLRVVHDLSGYFIPEDG